VTAHSEIADIVKENNPGGARRVHRIAEQRANHHIRAARFVDDGRPKIIVPFAKQV
jgi:hypothetical protein